MTDTKPNKPELKLDSPLSSQDGLSDSFVTSGKKANNGQILVAEILPDDWNKSRLLSTYIGFLNNGVEGGVIRPADFNLSINKLVDYLSGLRLTDDKENRIRIGEQSNLSDFQNFKGFFNPDRFADWLTQENKGKPIQATDVQSWIVTYFSNPENRIRLIYQTFQTLGKDEKSYTSWNNLTVLGSPDYTTQNENNKVFALALDRTCQNYYEDGYSGNPNPRERLNLQANEFFVRFTSLAERNSSQADSLKQMYCKRLACEIFSHVTENWGLNTSRVTKSELDYIADKGRNDIYLITPPDQASIIISIQSNLYSRIAQDFQSFLNEIYSSYDSAQNEREREIIKQVIAKAIADQKLEQEQRKRVLQEELDQERQRVADEERRVEEEEKEAQLELEKKNKEEKEAQEQQQKQPQTKSNGGSYQSWSDSGIDISSVKQAVGPVSGISSLAAAAATGLATPLASSTGEVTGSGQIQDAETATDRTNYSQADSRWQTIISPQSSENIDIASVGGLNIGLQEVDQPVQSQTPVGYISADEVNIQATVEQNQSTINLKEGISSAPSSANMGNVGGLVVETPTDTVFAAAPDEQQLEKAAGIETVVAEFVDNNDSQSATSTYSQFPISTDPQGRIFIAAPGGLVVSAESSSQALAIQEALSKEPQKYASEHDIDPEIVKMLEEMGIGFEEELGRNPNANEPNYNQAIGRMIGMRGNAKNAFYSYALAKARMAKARQNVAKKRSLRRQRGADAPSRGVISTSRNILPPLGSSLVPMQLDPDAQAEYDKLAAQGYQDINQSDIEQEVANLNLENGVITPEQDQNNLFASYEQLKRENGWSDEDLKKTLGSDYDAYKQWEKKNSIDTGKDFSEKEKYDYEAWRDMQREMGYSEEDLKNSMGQAEYDNYKEWKRRMGYDYNQFSDESGSSKKDFDPYAKDVTSDDLAKNGYDYVPIRDENGNTTYVPIGKNDTGIGEEKEANSENLQKAEDGLENQIDRDKLDSNGVDRSKNMSPQELENYARQQRHLSNTRKNARRQKQDSLADKGKKAADMAKNIRNLANLSKLGSAIAAALGPLVPFIIGALIVLLVVISAVITLRQAYCTDDLMDLRNALEGAALVYESQQKGIAQAIINLAPENIAINLATGVLKSQNGQIALTEFGRTIIRTFCPERESAFECGPGATGNPANVSSQEVIEGAKGIACLALKDAPGLTPNMRALMRAISYIEGASDKEGYRRLVGGRQIPGNTHPGIEDPNLFRTTGLDSDAFGRYQFISTTYIKDAQAAGIPVAKEGVNSKGEKYYRMTDADQDFVMYNKLKSYSGLQADVDAGTLSIEEIAQKHSGPNYYGLCQWASMPTCAYQKQQSQKSSQFYGIYRELQKEENSPGGCGARAALNNTIPAESEFKIADFNPLRIFGSIEANAQKREDGLDLLVDGLTGITLKDNGRITSLDSSGGGIDYALSFKGTNGNAATRGFPILSHLDGEVTYVVGGQSGFVKGTQSGSFGNEVGVYYPSINVTAIYSHLDSVNVQKGQKVTPGTLLGKQGSSGSTVGAEGEFVHVSLNLFNGKVEGQVGASTDTNLYTSFMKDTLRFYAANREKFEQGQFENPIGVGVSSEVSTKCVCKNADPVTFSTPAGAVQGTGQKQTGKASFYGTGNGPGGDTFGPEDKTFSGDQFDPEGMTAAAMAWPQGTIVRVTNKRNGKSVVVRINDTGRFDEMGRLIDLTVGAARKIDMINEGIADVEVEVMPKGTPVGSNHRSKIDLSLLARFFGTVQANAQSRPSNYGDITDEHKKFLNEIAKTRGYTSLPDLKQPNPQMVAALSAMMSESQKAGAPLRIVSGQQSTSGYRTLDEQTRLYFGGIENIWQPGLTPQQLETVRRDYLERAKSSAPPGFSEHSAGLAVDFSNNDSLTTAYANTSQYRWLKANASKFGFVESYPQGSKAGAGWEPWHWRFDGNDTYKLDKNINQLKLEGGQPVTTQTAGVTCPSDSAAGGVTAFGNTKQGGYAYPVPKNVKMNSAYGWRATFGKFHYGADFAADFGTPIFAAAAGTVSFAGWNDGGFGNLVILDHDNGDKTYYAHNQKILVKVGQKVQQGQQIAEMGSTGFSTGPHLHFEIHRGGQRIDPCIELDDC